MFESLRCFQEILIFDHHNLGHVSKVIDYDKVLSVKLNFNP